MAGNKFKNKKPIIYYCLLLIAYCLLFFSLSCGKKSPPTLKAYEKPKAPSDLSVIHREDRLILSWSYPDNLRQALKGFHVLRSGGNGFDSIVFTPNDKNSYIDREFRENNAYRYKVVAESMKGISSDGSNIITLMPRPLPSPPNNVRFTIKNDLIEFSWDSSGKGVCYNIYRATEKSKYSDNPVNRAPVCNTSYKDSANPDAPVYYSIRALLNTDIRDEGYASAELEVNPLHFIPSPPSDLRIVMGDDRAHLMWKESPESWVKGYRVYRKIEGETEFKMLGEVKVPAFTDTERIGKKRWYMVKALGPSVESRPLVAESIGVMRAD